MINNNTTTQKIKTYVFSNWKNDIKTYDNPIKINAENRKEAKIKAEQINKYAELISIEHND